MIYGYYLSTNTSSRHSLLQVCSNSALWEALTHPASVIWNLNLINIIVLLVRHFLLALCSIDLRSRCSAPLPGDKRKPV